MSQSPTRSRKSLVEEVAVAIRDPSPDGIVSSPIKKADAAEEKSGESGAADEKLTCPHCSRVFKGKHGLKIHLGRKCLKNTTDDSDDEKKPSATAKRRSSSKASTPASLPSKQDNKADLDNDEETLDQIAVKKDSTKKKRGRPAKRKREDYDSSDVTSTKDGKRSQPKRPRKQEDDLANLTDDTPGQMSAPKKTAVKNGGKSQAKEGKSSQSKTPRKQDKDTKIEKSVDLTEDKIDGDPKKTAKNEQVDTPNQNLAPKKSNGTTKNGGTKSQPKRKRAADKEAMENVKDGAGEVITAQRKKVSERKSKPRGVQKKQATQPQAKGKEKDSDDGADEDYVEQSEEEQSDSNDEDYAESKPPKPKEDESKPKQNISAEQAKMKRNCIPFKPTPPTPFEKVLEENNPSTEEGEDSDAEKIQCRNCNATFKGREGLNWHIKNRVCRKPKTPRPPNKQKMTKMCPDCGRNFTSWTGFQYHLQNKVCSHPQGPIQEKPILPEDLGEKQKERNTTEDDDDGSNENGATLVRKPRSNSDDLKPDHWCRFDYFKKVNEGSIYVTKYGMVRIIGDTHLPSKHHTSTAGRKDRVATYDTKKLDYESKMLAHVEGVIYSGARRRRERLKEIYDQMGRDDSTNDETRVNQSAAAKVWGMYCQSVTTHQILHDSVSWKDTNVDPFEKLQVDAFTLKDPRYPADFYPDRIVECELIPAGYEEDFDLSNCTGPKIRMFLGRKELTQKYEEEGRRQTCCICGESFRQVVDWESHVKNQVCLVDLESKQNERERRLEEREDGLLDFDGVEDDTFLSSMHTLLKPKTFDVVFGNPCKIKEHKKHKMPSWIVFNEQHTPMYPELFVLMKYKRGSQNRNWAGKMKNSEEYVAPNDRRRKRKAKQRLVLKYEKLSSMTHQAEQEEEKKQPQKRRLRNYTVTVDQIEEYAMKQAAKAEATKKQLKAIEKGDIQEIALQQAALEDAARLEAIEETPPLPEAAPPLQATESVLAGPNEPQVDMMELVIENITDEYNDVVNNENTEPTEENGDKIDALPKPSIPEKQSVVNTNTVDAPVASAQEQSVEQENSLPPLPTPVTTDKVDAEPKKKKRRWRKKKDKTNSSNKEEKKTEVSWLTSASDQLKGLADASNLMRSNESTVNFASLDGDEKCEGVKVARKYTNPVVIDTQVLVAECDSGRYPSLSRFDGTHLTECVLCTRTEVDDDDPLVDCDFCKQTVHQICMNKKMLNKEPPIIIRELEPHDSIMCHDCVMYCIARRVRAESRRLSKWHYELSKVGLSQPDAAYLEEEIDINETAAEDSNTFENSDKDAPTYAPCPKGGPGGLICCPHCSASYSRYLSNTAKEMESQSIAKAGQEVNEILDLLEDAKQRLLHASCVNQTNEIRRRLLRNNEV